MPFDELAELDYYSNNKSLEQQAKELDALNQTPLPDMKNLWGGSTTYCKIVEAAIKFKSGVIITGKRHGDCFRRFEELYPEADHTGEIQGFITTGLQFVDRFEAGKIALFAKQIEAPDSEKVDLSKGIMLYSEDLY